MINVCISDKAKIAGCGIGDTLLGLLIVQGLKDKGEDVCYYSPYPKFSDLFHANNQHFSVAPTNSIFLYEGYSENYRKNPVLNRLDLLNKDLRVTPKIPKIRKIVKNRIFEHDYILISPTTHWKSRQWNVENFRYLEHLILEKTRFKTVLIDSVPDIIKNFQGTFFYGQPPEFLLNLFSFATAIVANDSFASHFAGILNKTCFAIHAALPHNHLFSGYETITSITPNDCKACYFQHKNGYRQACDLGCWALNSITPKIVFDRILKHVT